MVEINIQFSPRVVIGSMENLSSGLAEHSNRALIVADSKFEASARTIQDRLDHRGIDSILFLREKMTCDSAALNDSLSLARGSRSRMVLSVGGEEVLSLARIAAAAAPGRDGAAALMEQSAPVGPGLPLTELPAEGSHLLLYRDAAKLTDTATRRTVLVPLAPFDSHHVVFDPAFTENWPPMPAAFSASNILAAAIEAFLSSRANFLTDVQARSAVREIADLIRDAAERHSELDFRVREAELSVLSGFSAGLTGLGPTMVLALAASSAAETQPEPVYSILLPWALESPLYAGSPKIKELSHLLTAPGETASGNPANDLRLLFARVGLPGRLRELGLQPEGRHSVPHWAAEMLKPHRTDGDEGTLRELLESAS